MNGKIVVVGSANVDFVMQVRNLPRRGETVVSSRFIQLFGGKGANQAVAAAKAGGDVSFVGCVGDDAFGPLMKENLAAVGVNVDHLAEAAGVASGAALILVDQVGGNIVSIAAGANSRVSSEMIQAHNLLIARAAMLILQHEIPTESIYTAIDFAYWHGPPVLLNLAPVGAFDPARLARVTYLIVNETEAEALCGFRIDTDADVIRAADWLLACGVNTVIITRGAAGAYIARGGFRATVPAFEVTPVDTTAAGDTFCGALAAALVEGKELREAVRFACAAAALCVTRLGAQASIPDRDEIEALLTGN